VLVSLLAAALAAVQLVPTAELSGLSIRSEGLTFQEVVSFSLNPTTLLYSLFPPIGLDLTRIMGQAFGEWVVYLGVSGFILAWLGIFSSVWQPTARRFVLLATTGLVLSLGVFLGPLFLFDVLVGLDSELFHSLARWSHPYYLLYRLVPGFDLFRVPARWLLLYAFGMAGLAGFGFQALLHPALFRSKLSSVRACLQGQPIWRTGLAVVSSLVILALIVWSAPPLRTLAAWLLLAGITVSLIVLIVRSDSRKDPAPGRSGGSPRAIPLILTALIVTELFWASQALSYNQPTAPQAYHSTRNAISFLQAALHQNDLPPGRFLSLSGITYDPGDLADLQQLFGDHLSEKALYDLVVASKEKEVLFYNLPLVYGLYSVDGYDGGILPLSKFITMQELFLPPAELSRDGRLREKLQFVPPGRLLSLLGTRWVVTDKQFDTWIEGIFYDLQFPARLAPGQSIATDEVPEFLPTAIGLVSHLEAAVGLPEGSPVARLTLTFADESRATMVLRAGQDTAEGAYPTGGAAHNQARAGVVWPYAADGVDYISVQPLPAARPITNISLEAVLPEGEFVLRGLSLIHEPTHTSRSVLLTTDGSYRQVHSGDVKIYENLSVLPRTYIVHQAEIVSDDEEALAILRRPQFEPTEQLVRLRNGDMSTGLARAGHPSSRDAATIVTYEPEYISVRATLESPGWLFLGDTYYPGWQATVNGQPVELFQANVLFRAVPVPAGEHLIEFEFRPRSLQWGALVSGLAALCLVAGLIVAGLNWPGRDQANQV
jgi:hypothetical protein